MRIAELVRLRWLVGTGLGIGVLQFSFLYLGMAAGMPAVAVLERFAQTLKVLTSTPSIAAARRLSTSPWMGAMGSAVAALMLAA